MPTQPYRWTHVAIVADGFMPGIVFPPTVAGVAYARSDMGGGYRLGPPARGWVPLMDFTRDYVETGVESIALDPTDPARVYFAAGTATADWAPKGFLLHSKDRGEQAGCSAALAAGGQRRPQRTWLRPACVSSSSPDRT